MSVSLTNIPSWLGCLHDLVLSRLSFAPDLDWRKTIKGCGCIEKEVETKLSIHYIKKNLQQFNEIAVFII